MSQVSLQLLFLLLVLLPVGAVLVRNFREGRRDLGLFHSRSSERDVFNLYAFKSFFGSLFFLLFLACGILAAVGFTWGKAPIEEDRSGQDIVILLDVSRSMLAQDVKPSRLDRSRDIVRGLVRELPGARFGVAVFKGSAVSEIPVTEDTVSIDSFMDYVSPQMLTTPGTNLEDGIRTALTMFPTGTGRFRTIVVFSDGESLSGNAVAAADEAARQGVRIYTVLAGTEAGTTIPLADGTLVRDSAGQPVVTRADPSALTAIAEQTGGTAFRLTDPAVFASLLSDLHQAGAVSSDSGFRLEPVLRFRFFLALALLFLAIHLAVRIVRWRTLF